MRLRTLPAVSLSCLFLAACDNDTSVSTTGPAIRYSHTPSAPCDAALGREISQAQNSLFSRAVLTAARAAWSPVVNNCVSNLTQAREQMMSYVQFVIDAYEAGNVAQPRVGTKEDAVLAHINADFLYVGYAAPNLPVAVFGNEGAIGVIGQSTVNRELAAAHAAITVPIQAATGDQRGHLYSIYPLTAGCLTGTNLVQNGPCFDIAAHPAIAPKFDPLGKAGICQPVDEDDVLPGNVPALGHLQDAGNTTITGATGIYPTFCPHDQYTGSWTGGFGDMATRLAWLANKALGVKVAYAANGGLGGLDTDFESEFGAVDLLVFKETFTGDTIGSTPDSSADVGTWDTPVITHPGSITVQSSLADLGTQPVVLSQGGGNCGDACGGLMFQGRLASAGSLATEGKYRVEWYSVQTAPSVKGAPFILSGTAGEIARVTYSTVGPDNRLSYNDTKVGNWTRNVTDTFEIEVNLDAKRTTLKLNGDSVASDTITATNFVTITADFRGIDSGVMGWDNITVRRLSDR